ncbi:MAG: hypothetical protein U1A78_31715 [Polyangia bacterium]
MARTLPRFKARAVFVSLGSVVCGLAAVQLICAVVPALQGSVAQDRRGQGAPPAAAPWIRHGGGFVDACAEGGRLLALRYALLDLPRTPPHPWYWRLRCVCAA